MNPAIVAVLVLASLLAGSLVILIYLAVACVFATPSCGRQATCFPHEDASEWGERCVARSFTGPMDRVLEFGGGAGSVSTVVQEQLFDKTRHVVVQPAEDGMFGGLEALKQTKDVCGAQFTIVDHVLQEGETAGIVQVLGGAPTCLVVDCENCLVGEYEKNPELFSDVRVLQVERDDFDGSYTDLLTNTLQLKKIHTGDGCDGRCATEVWVKK